MGKDNIKDNVKLFDGNDYYGWKEQVQMYLVYQNMSYLTEAIPLPLEPPTPIDILNISHSFNTTSTSTLEKGKEKEKEWSEEEDDS